jgi:hypothetical protein
VASLPGLEPGTYCLEGSCSVQLSYRDRLAVQLPELRTIHPKKIPGPTQPTRDFFVFIVTPPSCLNKFTALTLARGNGGLPSVNQGQPAPVKCGRGCYDGWLFYCVLKCRMLECI